MENTKLKRKPGNEGSTVRILQEISRTRACSSCSSTPDEVMAKSWRKCIIHIPIEPASTQDCEYANDFVQQLIHNANQTKERNASKLQLKITQPTRNEISIYKLICNLQTALYQIPNNIGAIMRCDSNLSWSCSSGFRDFELRFSRTDWAWWSRRRVVLFW